MLSANNPVWGLNRDHRDITMLPEMQHQFAYNHGRTRDGAGLFRCTRRGM